MTLFVVGTLLLLFVLAWGTFQSAQILREIPVDFNLLLLPSENLVRVLLIGVCLGLGQVSGISYAQLGWISFDPARDLASGLIIGGVVAMAIPPLTHLAVARWGSQIYSPLVVRSVLPRSAREWVLVPLALVPAVSLEELIFRSLLLGGFRVFAPPLLLALVWSAIFGAMHLPQGALGMFVAAGLGMLLSAVFLATESLLAPLIAHYVINLLQLVWASNDKTWLERISSSRSHP